MSITLREFDRLTEKGEVYRNGRVPPAQKGAAAAYAALRDLIVERRAAQEEDDGSNFFSKHLTCALHVIP